MYYYLGILHMQQSISRSNYKLYCARMLSRNKMLLVLMDDLHVPTDWGDRNYAWITRHDPFFAVHQQRSSIEAESTANFWSHLQEMPEILAFLTLLSVFMISGVSAWVIDQNEESN